MKSRRKWVIGVIGLAASAALAGCGADRTGSQHATADTRAVEPLAQPAEAVPVSSQPAMPAQAEVVPRIAPVSESATGMAPDIIVSVTDTLVRPGQAMEFNVDATPDVEVMELWDGIHDRQAFHYDVDAKAWRLTYRVPLTLPWERTGISITARNASNRWARKWVFIRYATGPEVTAEAPGDSVDGS